MLVGISGVKGSGKDTIADILVEDFGFTKIAFADDLKLSVGQTLNITRSDIDEWKNIEHIRVVVENKKAPSTHLVDLSFRELLQRWGTEGHRHVFGTDFWVEQLFRRNLDWKKDFVIPDARFFNEIEKIKSFFGSTIILVEGRATSSDSHASETEFLNNRDEFDAYIENSGTLDQLRETVHNLMRVRYNRYAFNKEMV